MTPLPLTGLLSPSTFLSLPSSLSFSRLCIAAQALGRPLLPPSSLGRHPSHSYSIPSFPPPHSVDNPPPPPPPPPLSLLLTLTLTFPPPIAVQPSSRSPSLSRPPALFRPPLSPALSFSLILIRVGMTARGCAARTRTRLRRTDPHLTSPPPHHHLLLALPLPLPFSLYSAAFPPSPPRSLSLALLAPTPPLSLSLVLLRLPASPVSLFSSFDPPSSARLAKPQPCSPFPARRLAHHEHSS